MSRYKHFFLALCLALLLDTTLTQTLSSSLDVTSSGLAPGDPPAECSTSTSFSFSIINQRLSNRRVERSVDSVFTSPRSKFANSLPNQRRNDLTINLAEGMIVDEVGRTGGIRADGQLIFQDNTTADLVYTRPFSICRNNSLALGATTNWIQCINGSIANLYYFVLSENLTCSAIDLIATFNEAASTSTSPAASSNTANTSVVSPSPTTPPAGMRTSHGIAIAGGVIGGLSGLGLMTSASLFYLFRRSKRLRGMSVQPRRNEMDANASQVRELYASRPPIEVQDISTSRFGELYSGRPPVELHDTHTMELYGSNVPELYSHTRR